MIGIDKWNTFTKNSLRQSLKEQKTYRLLCGEGFVDEIEMRLKVMTKALDAAVRGHRLWAAVVLLHHLPDILRNVEGHKQSEHQADDKVMIPLQGGSSTHLWLPLPNIYRIARPLPFNNFFLDKSITHWRVVFSSLRRMLLVLSWTIILENIRDCDQTHVDRRD